MKKVRRFGRAAGMLLLFCEVLLCCAGCREKTDGGLQTLVLSEEESDGQTDGAGGSAPEEHRGSESNAEQEKSAGSGGSDESAQETVFVYVCGAVKVPGVYELKPDARVYEAVACAGGVREDAAEEYVNLAQPVSDGERIYIPTVEEAEQGIAEWVPADPGTDHDSGTEERKVNINTASREELKTLSGIGDSKAESIIAYREANGAFQSIEELMNVDGIKDGVFNKIKDRITVNAGS